MNRLNSRTLVLILLRLRAVDALRGPLHRLRPAFRPLPLARQFPQHPCAVDPCRGDGDRHDLRAARARRRPFRRFGHVPRGGRDGPLPVGRSAGRLDPRDRVDRRGCSARSTPVFITGLRIASFIVTLATLFIGRGFALYLSETKMVFQSDTVQTLGRVFVPRRALGDLDRRRLSPRSHGSRSLRRPMGARSMRSGPIPIPRRRPGFVSRRSCSRCSASAAYARRSAR